MPKSAPASAASFASSMDSRVLDAPIPATMGVSVNWISLRAVRAVLINWLRSAWL